MKRVDEVKYVKRILFIEIRCDLILYIPVLRGKLEVDRTGRPLAYR